MHLGKAQIPTTFVALAVAGEWSAGAHLSEAQAPTEVILGSASLIAHDMDTRPDLSPWLASVFVAEQHRGKGIGTALVRRVVQEAGMLGVANLYLFTTPDMYGFYARLGWTLIEHTHYRGYRQIVMTRSIARP
jgi:GNAT superfamily N-acetyltransferase